MSTLFATKYRDYLICAAAVLILLTGLISDNKYTLDILITMVYFCTLASAWNIMCGFTGQLSLGHGAFLGLGQYTSTLLFTRLDISPWIGMMAGGLTAMLLAMLVGLTGASAERPVLRIGDDCADCNHGNISGKIRQHHRGVCRDNNTLSAQLREHDFSELSSDLLPVCLLIGSGADRYDRHQQIPPGVKPCSHSGERINSSFAGNQCVSEPGVCADDQLFLYRRCWYAVRAACFIY